LKIDDYQSPDAENLHSHMPVPFHETKFLNVSILNKI